MELHTCFLQIEDTRRKQGQRYQLSYVLLFAVLALLSNASSYRMMESYVKAHLKLLKRTFKIKWKRFPSYGQIRNILLGISTIQIENAFRHYSKKMASEKKNIPTGQKRLYIAFDGKTLRGSMNRFEEHKALHQISAFDLERDIILGHIDVNEKSNEIPAVQELIQKLGLKGVLYTMDAMHCQKKRF